MKLLIENGTLYVNNSLICHCEAGNGRPNIPTGRYQVVPEFSHVHGHVLLDAIGLGWIGPMPGCDVVLGGVRGRNGVIPSRDAFGRVLQRVEDAVESLGQDAVLDVR